MIFKLGSKFIVYSREVEDIVSLALKEDISKFQLFSLGKPMKLNALNVDDIIYGKNFIPFSPPPQATGLEQSVIMGMLPFSHISGILLTFSIGFFTGSKIVIFPKYSQEAFLEGIRKFKITNWCYSFHLI
ncbi:hypothetical protein Avbf_17479, partial [Armadillidium vulgare]